MKQLVKKALHNKVFSTIIHAIPFSYPKQKLLSFNQLLDDIKDAGPVGCFEILKRFEHNEFNKDGNLPVLLKFIPITLINPPEAWDKYDQNLFVFDERGKVKVQYPSGIHVNPTSICQYALSIYDTYFETKDEKYEELFFKQVGFLIEEGEESGGEVRFPYRFDFFDMLKGPWISGLAQAQAGSVFLRAYILSKDTKYLDLAKKSVDVINARNKLDIVVNGYRWAEEYPTDKPSCVINGLAWIIISLLEMSLFFPKDIVIKNQLDDYLKTYKSNVDYYDVAKDKVKYSLMNDTFVNNSYRGFQCLQMLHIYYYTKDLFFYQRHIKWQDNFDHTEFVSAYLPFNIMNRRLRDISKGL